MPDRSPHSDACFQIEKSRPVGWVSFGTFALVTGELMPIGLLPKIAGQLGVTEGAAGLMVTIPGAAVEFACSSAGPALHKEIRR